MPLPLSFRPEPGVPLLHGRILIGALLALTIASGASAAPLAIRVGPTELHYAWPDPGGSVAGYRIRVSRNGGPYVLEQSVARNEAWIPANGGEIISLTISPFYGYGVEGPPSDPSRPTIVLAPSDDTDADGEANGVDPCPFHANDASDRDADGIPDACDSCPDHPDARGTDLDGDGYGDACDPDADGDGTSNEQDLCPLLALPEDFDQDQDGVGDRCDPCNTWAWSDPPLNPPDQHSRQSGIIFKYLRTPDAQGIRLEGKFMPGSAWASVEPAWTGLSFRVEDADGPIIALGIPGGWEGDSPCDARDGWKLTYSGGDPVWRYLNRSGSLDTESCEPAAARLVTAIVRDKRASRGWVEYVLEFRDLKLNHVPAIPARDMLSSVSLGDHESRWQPGPAARSAACGETFLASPASTGLRKPFCKPGYYLGALNKITCKGL